MERPWSGLVLLLWLPLLVTSGLDVWSPDIKEDQQSEVIFNRLVDAKVIVVDEFGDIHVHNRTLLEHGVQQVTRLFDTCDPIAANNFQTVFDIINDNYPAAGRQKRALELKDKIQYIFTILSPYIFGPDHPIAVFLTEGRRFTIGIGLSDFVNAMANMIGRFLFYLTLGPIQMIVSAVANGFPALLSAVDLFNSLTSQLIRFLLDVVGFLGSTAINALPGLSELLQLVARLMQNSMNLMSNWANSINSAGLQTTAATFRSLLSSQNIMEKVINGKLNLFQRIMQNLPSIVNSPTLTPNLNVLLAPFSPTNAFNNGREFINSLVKLSQNTALFPSLSLPSNATLPQKETTNPALERIASLGPPALLFTALAAFIKLPFILVYMTTATTNDKKDNDDRDAITKLFSIIDPNRKLKTVLKEGKETIEEFAGLTQDVHDAVLDVSKAAIQKLNVPRFSFPVKDSSAPLGAIGRLFQNLRQNWNYVKSDMIQLIEKYGVAQKGVSDLGKNAGRLVAASSLFPWIVFLTLSGGVASATKEVLTPGYTPENDMLNLLRSQRSIGVDHSSNGSDIFTNYIMSKLNLPSLLFSGNTNLLSNFTKIDTNRPLPIETDIVRALGRLGATPNPKVDALLRVILASRNTEGPRKGRMSELSVPQQFQEVLSGRLNLIPFIDNLMNKVKEFFRRLNPLHGIMTEISEALKGDDTPLRGFLKAFPGFGLFEEFRLSNPGITPLRALGFGALIAFKVVFFAPIWIPLVLLRTLNEEQIFDPFRNLLPRLTLEEVLHPTKRQKRFLFELQDLFHEPSKSSNPFIRFLDAVNPLNALIRSAERSPFGAVFSQIRRLRINPLEKLGVAALISLTVLSGTLGVTFGLLNMGRGHRQNNPLGTPFGKSQPINLPLLLSGNRFNDQSERPSTLLEQLPLLGLFLTKSVILPFPISLLGIIGFFSVLLMGGGNRNFQQPKASPNLNLFQNSYPSLRDDVPLSEILRDIHRNLPKMDTQQESPSEEDSENDEPEEIFSWIKTTPTPSSVKVSESTVTRKPTITFSFTDFEEENTDDPVTEQIDTVDIGNKSEQL